MYTGFLNVVPDCEEIEIRFIPDPVDDHAYITEKFCFPVNTLVGRCDVLVYKDDRVLYNVSYRYKNIKEYSDWQVIPSDTENGYYTEDSYTANGTLKPSPEVGYFPYPADAVNGFVRLLLSPYSIYRFRQNIDKGDLIGVNTIYSFSGVTVKTLRVGIDKNYQYIPGDVVLENDIFFDLDLTRSVEGNEFRIHFDCASLDLNTKNFYITQGFGTPDQAILKKFERGDVFAMLNQDGGVVFDCKFKNNISPLGGSWIIYQNYDLGLSNEIRTVDGLIADYFDETDGMGKVRGFFGFCVCNAARTVAGVNVPDLKKHFLIGAAPTVAGFNEGEIGGEEMHEITIEEMPEHDHFVLADAGVEVLNEAWPAGRALARGNVGAFGTEGTNAAYRLEFAGNAIKATQGNSSTVGENEPFSLFPTYYAVIYAKKTY